jgi:hypothetical protein
VSLGASVNPSREPPGLTWSEDQFMLQFQGMIAEYQRAQVSFYRRDRREQQSRATP